MASLFRLIRQISEIKFYFITSLVSANIVIVTTDSSMQNNCSFENNFTGITVPFKKLCEKTS